MSGRAEWPGTGVLPREVELPKSGGKRAYPALCDEGESVGMALYLKENEAALHHRRGILRLFKLGNAAQVKLSEREAENERLLAQIVLKEADLADQQNRIDALQLVLANQEKELSDYQAQIADILGVRTRIVQELSAQLASARISATVDEKTGDIVLDSSLMFETGSSTLKAEGLAQLNRLIPVYLGVLLQDEYRDYVAEIIIEGHTDSTGSYEHNLELSQNRALNVAKYCLNMGTLTQTQKTRLKSIITAQGRSFSDPVYDENGVEDQERSRRVEIKFRLKDAEMIQRMNSILSSME